MTEDVTVVYWRDIPLHVVAGNGRQAQRIALPDRFQEASDRAASRAGVTSSDDYTAQIRRVTVTGPDDARVVADQLDADHPDTVLEALVKNHGRRG